MQISVNALKFTCPACGGSECVSTATEIGQLAEFPVVCSGCGASAKLKGFVLYFAVMLALVIVLFWFYEHVVHLLSIKYPAAKEIIGFAVFGAMALVIGSAHRYLGPLLLKWELGQSSAPPDEKSFRIALRKNWGYLVPVTLFGPAVIALGGFRDNFGAIVFLFFGSLGAAILPVMSGRAPFGFWALAIALWFASGALALTYG